MAAFWPSLALTVAILLMQAEINSVWCVLGIFEQFCYGRIATQTT